MGTPEYHAYGNAGGGDPIDYATVLATTTGTTTTLGQLSAPGVWSFGVRASNGYGEDANVDAVVTITVDASGRDVSGVPLPPASLLAVPGPGGSIVVHWGYPPAAPGRMPTGFHVYQGAGTTPNYSSPVATVAAVRQTATQRYSAAISGLAGGITYRFGVRSYNATGEESNTITATATVNASPPMAVQSFTATATI